MEIKKKSVHGTQCNIPPCNGEKRGMARWQNFQNGVLWYQTPKQSYKIICCSVLLKLSSIYSSYHLETVGGPTDGRKEPWKDRWKNGWKDRHETFWRVSHNT